MSSATGPLPRSADVVVIGGGIVGSASAYFLAGRGLRVVLLEKGRIAGEQSGRNWGFVRQQARDPAELPLMMASNTMWRSLSGELEADVDWVQGGNLALTPDDATAERYREWQKLGREFGLDTRVLSPREIPGIVPGLRGDWVAGMYTSSDGHADPVKATSAFARAAERRGATIATGHAALGLESAGGSVAGARTAAGAVRAPLVVCAAGVWSRALLRTVGVNLPQHTVTETVAMTEPVAPVTRTCVWAPDLAFRQRVDGRMVISVGGVGLVHVTLDSLRQARLFLPSFLRNRRFLRLRVGGPLAADAWSRLRGDGGPTFTGPDPRPYRRDVLASVAALRRSLPALGGVRVERAWAGRIDATPDALPVIGTVEGVSGLLVATGLSGHGFALGPIVGRIVADLLTGNETEFDLAPMRLSRFAEGTYTTARIL